MTSNFDTTADMNSDISQVTLKDSDKLDRRYRLQGEKKCLFFSIKLHRI